MKAIFDDSGGRPYADLSFRDTFEYGTSGSNNGAFSNRYTRSNVHIIGQPALVFDANGFRENVERQVLVIVPPRVEIDFMSNGYVPANADFSEIVQGAIVSYPAVIADFEVPGISNLDG